MELEVCCSLHRVLEEHAFLALLFRFAYLDIVDLADFELGVVICFVDELGLVRLDPVR